MAYPRSFRDDGEVLFIDLHGCKVEDALELVKRTLNEGARRGRARVDVVHGYSSSTSPYERTIRNALSDAWERGDYDRWVADIRWDDVGGRCAMWLNVGATRDPTRVTVADLM